MSVRTYPAFDEKLLLIPGNSGIGRSTPITIKRIDINSRVGTDHWLMLFSGLAVPADATVPLFPPIYVPANYVGFAQFDNGRVIPEPGAVLALSSNQQTLVHAAIADDFDIVAEVEEFEFSNVDGLTNGLASGTPTLEVWADAAGPKSLRHVGVVNTSGAVRYLQIFAKDAPADGLEPLRSMRVGIGESKHFDFGTAGYSPIQIDADNTVHDGCTLVWSTTQSTKTGAASGTLSSKHI